MPPFPYTISPIDADEKFMLESLKEAWKAYCADEVPVGAVLVKEGQIIARGHNQMETLKDATAHAEMLCITAGEAACENWRLNDTMLYCTMEPCAMCAGAMLLTRVPRLIWGAPDLRHGANGSWTNLLEMRHPMHSIVIKRGVLGEFSAKLMRNFFQKKRHGSNEGRHIVNEELIS